MNAPPLEAVYTHSSASVSTGTWTGIIDDYYGHIVAYVDGETASATTLHWQRTRSIGYGPAPDSPVFYVSKGASVVQATAWRGKRQDITAFYLPGRAVLRASKRAVSLGRSVRARGQLELKGAGRQPAKRLGVDKNGYTNVN